jgi:hypothetical protein
MLVHELFQEQVIHDRAQELETLRAGKRADATHSTRVPSFVRTIIPAITHGLAGIPGPPRTAGC